MAAILKTITDHFDEALAVGLGIVVTDYFGDTVAGWVSRWVPAQWLDPVSEILIGLAIIVLGEWIAPYAYKAYTRLAAFGALGVGIADAISIALGFGKSGSLGSPHAKAGSSGVIESGGSESIGVSFA